MISHRVVDRDSLSRGTSQILKTIDITKLKHRKTLCSLQGNINWLIELRLVHTLIKLCFSSTKAHWRDYKMVKKGLTKLWFFYSDVKWSVRATLMWVVIFRAVLVRKTLLEWSTVIFWSYLSDCHAQQGRSSCAQVSFVFS